MSHNKEEEIKLADATEKELKTAGFVVQKSLEGMEQSIPKQNTENEKLADAIEAKIDKVVEDISKTVESVEATAPIFEKVGSIKKKSENKENGKAIEKDEVS